MRTKFKTKRKKLVLASLEKLLAKNERRIQTISMQSYELRETIDRIKEAVEKKEGQLDGPTKE